MDDESFLKAFEDRTLPFELWTHRAHIKMAYLVLRRDGYEGALPKVRAGIRAYNQAHNVPESLERGYHDTITVAWLRIVNATIRNHGTGDGAEDFCNRQPHLLQRTLLRLFYSRGRLMSLEAKAAFVEPDLLPLPPA